MNLELAPALLAVCRLDAGSPIPTWATDGTFFSISRTNDELSVICPQSQVPPGTKAEKDLSLIHI